ncbi:MAG: nucleotide-binding protein [Methanoculleaceae archaeon]
MKIGSIRLRISPVASVTGVIFTLILIGYVSLTGASHILFWAVPTIIALFIIPVGMNYLSQKEYRNLVPFYERDARPMRIKAINESMLGQNVRIEGVVERVYFRYLNRPQYLLADRTGEISVKMFTTPAEDIREGDVVEVLGQVIRRYVLTGDPVINCVDIRRKVKE